MQVYKIRDFYYKLHIALAVVLTGMLVFAILNLNEIPMVLLVFPFIMIARVFSLCDRNILFCKGDHFEWDPGSMGQAVTVNYNAIINVEVSENLKSAELEVKEDGKIKKIALQLEYLTKDVRQEVASFLKSKEQTTMVPA